MPATEREFASLAEHVHCYRMLGSFEEAEDLVQETLLRAWRSRSDLAREERFRAWAYKIATNACLDKIERDGRRCRRWAHTRHAMAAALTPTGC